MSRSRKLPIIKDNGYGNKLYRRIVRRSIKNKLRSNLHKLINEEDADIPTSGKSIINDYDRSDYRFDYRFFDWGILKDDDEIRKVNSRK